MQASSKTETSQAEWLTPVTPVPQEVKTVRIVVQGQLRQKVSESFISTNKLGMVVHIPAM
jgi:hypothetical protein